MADFVPPAETGSAARIFMPMSGIDGESYRCKVCGGELEQQPSSTTPDRVWLVCPHNHYSKSVRASQANAPERTRVMFGAGKKVPKWV